jgi:branched-chain amino acid transport system permease protein
VWRLGRSRLGVYLSAIREDEQAAESLGIDAFRCKLYASILSAFLTGLGGAFYAFYYFSLQPNSLFGIPLSVEIVIRPIVGGAGTLLGPIIGSFILSPLAELSRTYFAGLGWSGAHLIVYGALLIGVVLFLPEGAYPYLSRRLARAPGAAGVTAEKKASA